MAWFLDLGANWANTLTLYQSVRTPAKNPAKKPAKNPARPLWNVVAFEASPLIQPFLRDYCAFLNGERLDEPENCIPRSGSTQHLLKYASRYGCPTSPDLGRQCMWKCLTPHLQALVADPMLNSSDYIKRALREALLPPLSQDRFTIVPAAVSDTNEWATIYEHPNQLVRGGALSRNKAGMQPKRVHAIDVAQWLLQLPADAYVLLKMDIEGAEHKLVRRMELLGSHRRISRVSIECHGNCGKTMQRILSWNVTVVTEATHNGMDERSKNHLIKPILPRCRCNSVDARF